MRNGIIFAGNGEWAVLALRKLHSEDRNIVGVICSAEDLRKEAKKLGLKILRPKSVNSKEFVDFVKKNVDLIVNVSHPEIYRSEILKAPKFGVINAHGGKLPRYGGRSPINWALINGEKGVGVTVHFMNEQIDAGNILEQETVAVGKNDNFLQVKEKTLPLYPRLVSRAVKKALLGKKGRKQGGKPLYCFKRKPEQSRISWGKSVLDIHNLVRASFNPEYYAFTKWKNRTVYITETSLVKRGTGPKGIVLNSNAMGALVGAGDGVILVKKAGFAKNKIRGAGKILKRGMRFN